MGKGSRAARSSALTSSMNTRSSFVASAGNSTRSRSVRPSSARSMLAAGNRPAVVTDGPYSVFSTTTVSKRALVATVNPSSTAGISGPIARPDRDRQNGRAEPVQVGQGAHQLRPVVHARDEHDLRVKPDPSLRERTELRDDVGRLRVA